MKTALPDLELDSDFDDDVDGRALAARGGEAPLAHRLHRVIVEPSAKALHDLDVADRSIASDDDLENHVARDAALAGILRVVRLHFSEQPWRLKAAAGPIRTAAYAAARSRTDARPIASADARSRPKPDTAVSSRSVAVGLRGGLLEYADAVS